jgi:hypothetical protein
MKKAADVVVLVKRAEQFLPFYALQTESAERDRLPKSPRKRPITLDHLAQSHRLASRALRS